MDQEAAEVLLDSLTGLMVLVVHADTTASSSLKRRFIFIFNFFTFITEACITYDRKTLVNTGRGSTGFGISAMDLETITTHNIF